MRDDIDSESDLLEPEDTLVDRGVDDVLDEGYSPPERPSSFFDGHEALDGRLSREAPEQTEDYGGGIGDGIGDASDTDGEPYDSEVGDRRAGRLVGVGETFARDVGIDGAAASAEEAAVHAIPDREI
jgi:hypothetical protein